MTSPQHLWDAGLLGGKNITRAEWVGINLVIHFADGSRITIYGDNGNPPLIDYNDESGEGALLV